jgi:beta-lactamase class D
LQTVVEVNSSLDANGLKDEVIRILGGNFSVYNMDRASIEFSPAGFFKRNLAYIAVGAGILLLSLFGGYRIMTRPR